MALVPSHLGQHSPGGCICMLGLHCRTGQAFLEQTILPPVHLHFKQGSSEITSLSSEAICPFIAHSETEEHHKLNLKSN